MNPPVKDPTALSSAIGIEMSSDEMNPSLLSETSSNSLGAESSPVLGDSPYKSLKIRLKGKYRDFLKNLQTDFFGFILPPLFDLICNSWPAVIETHPETQALLDNNQPVIYALWHGRSYSFVKASPRKKSTVLVSPSRDGDMIARVVGTLGFHVVRGSSKRNGAKALLLLFKELKRNQRSVIFLVDGPKGPRNVVKPGVVKVASQTGCPIVPIISSNRIFLRIFQNTWDKFHFPQFFSPMKIVFEAPIFIPGDLKTLEALEPHREALETFMIQKTREIDLTFNHRGLI
jgi:lysophospholipid acyltransferase (LPLAT)-like uncharacterized protein